VSSVPFILVTFVGFVKKEISAKQKKKSYPKYTTTKVRAQGIVATHQKAAGSTPAPIV
jgi:hypothetical protein